MSYFNKYNLSKSNVSNKNVCSNKNESIEISYKNPTIYRTPSTLSNNQIKSKDNKNSNSSVHKKNDYDQINSNFNNFSLYKQNNQDIIKNTQGFNNTVNYKEEDIRKNNGVNKNSISRGHTSNSRQNQEIKIGQKSNFPSSEEYLHKAKVLYEQNASNKSFSSKINNDKNFNKQNNIYSNSSLNKLSNNPSTFNNYHADTSYNNHIYSQKNINNNVSDKSMNNLINGISDKNKNENFDFLNEKDSRGNNNSKNYMNYHNNFPNKNQNHENGLFLSKETKMKDSNPIKIKDSLIKESPGKIEHDLTKENNLSTYNYQKDSNNKNEYDFQKQSDKKFYQKNSSFSLLQNNTEMPNNAINNTYEQKNNSKINQDQNSNINYFNNSDYNLMRSLNPSVYIHNQNKEINGYISNKIRDLIDDKDEEIPIQNKNVILKFYKKSDNVQNDTNLLLTQEEIFDQPTSKSIYIDQNKFSINDSDKNLKSYDELASLKPEIDHRTIYNKLTQEEIAHKNITKINKTIQNNNSIYVGGISNDSYNINRIINSDEKFRINSQCYDDLKRVFEGESSENEINNNKIFSSGSISKSFSSNLADYIRVQENILDSGNIQHFYVLLEDRYLEEFEFFLAEFKKCRFYNKELQYNKVGPISSLEHYIETKFYQNLETNTPIMEIDLLENNIFRWRNICGDGNCFYRAVMFSYIENLLIENKDLEFMNLIKEIYEFTKVKELKQLFDKNNINYDYLIKSLFYIILNKTMRNLSYDISKYEMFIILINNNRDIDLGLVLYLRIKIFYFIEENKTKIYSRDFNVKMGNLLSEYYEGDGENFLWKQFYEENLLKLYTEAENIIIYVTPLILKINLKIFTYDIGNENSNKFRFISCQLENKHTAFVFYRKTHYDLIYSKEHFEKIQNNFLNYVDYSISYVNIENLKKQVEIAKKQIEIKNEKERNKIEEEDKTMEIDNQIIENPNLINFLEENGNNKNSKNEYNRPIDNKDIIDINKIDIDVNNKNYEHKDMLDGSFNLLRTIDIEENVGNNKNEIFLKETNKSLLQKNSDLQSNNKILNSLYSNVQEKIPNNTILNFNDKSNKQVLIDNRTCNNSIKCPEFQNLNNDKKKNLENESQIKIEKNTISKLNENENKINQNFNKNINENKGKINPNSNFFTPGEKNIDLNVKENKNSSLCIICDNEIETKVTELMETNYCLTCIKKEIKSVLFIKISNTINNSINYLFNERFSPYSGVNFDENADVTIFNKKFQFKTFKDLSIDINTLIEDTIKENCLVCISNFDIPCETKSNIKFPCNLCRFDSIEHFQFFLKNLIVVNTSIKTKAFTCLCNKMFSLNDTLKIFELIKKYKLDDEFYAMKKYLIDINFKRICLSCKNILDNFKKYIITVKNQYITSFVSLTEFEHVLCHACFLNLNNKRNLIKGMQFNCVLCQLEHTLIYVDENYHKE